MRGLTFGEEGLNPARHSIGTLTAATLDSCLLPPARTSQTDMAGSGAGCELSPVLIPHRPARQHQQPILRFSPHRYSSTSRKDRRNAQEDGDDKTRSGRSEEDVIADDPRAVKAAYVVIPGDRNGGGDDDGNGDASDSNSNESLRLHTVCIPFTGTVQSPIRGAGTLPSQTWVSSTQSRPLDSAATTTPLPGFGSADTLAPLPQSACLMMDGEDKINTHTDTPNSQPASSVE